MISYVSKQRHWHDECPGAVSMQESYLSPEHLVFVARHSLHERNVRFRLAPTASCDTLSMPEMSVFSREGGRFAAVQGRPSLSQFRHVPSRPSHFTLRALQVRQPDLDRLRGSVVAMKSTYSDDPSEDAATRPEGGADSATGLGLCAEASANGSCDPLFPSFLSFCRPHVSI